MRQRGQRDDNFSLTILLIYYFIGESLLRWCLVTVSQLYHVKFDYLLLVCFVLSSVFDVVSQRVKTICLRKRSINTVQCSDIKLESVLFSAASPKENSAKYLITIGVASPSGFNPMLTSMLQSNYIFFKEQTNTKFGTNISQKLILLHFNPTII